LPLSPAERLEPTRPPGRHGFQNEPQRPSGFFGFISGLLTFAFLIMLLVAGLAALFRSQIEAPGPLAQTKIVVVPKGEGAHEIGTRLEKEGVIADRRLFVAGYLWAKFTTWLEGGKPVQLKAGDYEMMAAVSVRQAIDLLAEGKTITYKVTIPEGLTSYQVVERLRADPNLTGEIEVIPPEGSLLPETFIVRRGAARQTIIDFMQAEMRKLLDKAWPTRQKSLPFKTPEQAVILASIVEKETGRADERDRIAAVFINRLRKNMRLQSDPTILYGLAGGKAAWGRPIMKSEIQQKTTHNTYQIDGLPPTPICNPGRAAIEAVLNPANTKELYFVADGSGGHVFSETLNQHIGNVVKWRQVEKELKAKSGQPTAPEGTRAVIRTPPPKGSGAPQQAGAAVPGGQPASGPTASGAPSSAGPGMSQPPTSSAASAQ
jgi:UPF0755 protein